MWVIDLENPPPRLRGLLSRWGIEVRAGLYVGSTSGKVRDAIWELISKLASAETSAVMVFDAQGPQGFEVRTLGPNRREIVDIDGMWLARFTLRTSDAVEPDQDSLAPGADEFDPSMWDVDEGYLAP